MSVFVTLLSAIATGFAGVRWLRVAQREHYIPGSVTRFAFRWWRLGPNILLKLAASLCYVALVRHDTISIQPFSERLGDRFICGGGRHRFSPVMDYLARLEAKEMFEAILTRFEGLEVAADPATLPRVHSNLIDGFASVPIRWSRVN